MQRGDRNYVDELDGVGKEMPLVMTCFTIAGISLVGIPPLSGFVSKWKLAESAIATADPVLMVGAAVLLYSALMTAVYVLTIVVRAWFPTKGREVTNLTTEVGWRMKLPLVFFTVVIVLFGLYAQPLISFLESMM